MTTPALVLRQSLEGESQTTILHFGILDKGGPNVAINEESQMVFVTPEIWPKMKAAIDEYFKKETTAQNQKGKTNNE